MSSGIGETLRSAREEQGRSLEEAARDTRVRTDYLEALEDENFGIFGGDVYAKGFLSTYARYLKLDPTTLLDEYRRTVQHDDYAAAALAATPVGRTPRSAPPRWIGWAVAAVILVFGAIGLSELLGGRTPTPAEGRSEPVAAAPSPSPSPTPSPTPSPRPSPTFDGVELVLSFEERSWIRVDVDGNRIEEGIVEAGETRTFQGAETVTVRYGNPGGVRVALNGSDLGTAGAPGSPTTVTYGPDGPETQA